MTIRPKTINPPLLALAIGAFGIGVTEFAPMGMLPTIAADLGVSIPAAGLLVSAYAVGVLVGAPLMTLLSRLSRHTTKTARTRSPNCKERWWKNGKVEE